MSFGFCWRLSLVVLNLIKMYRRQAEHYACMELDGQIRPRAIFMEKQSDE
jgi:hypothetical protein